MARCIAGVCWLLLVNVAFAQAEPEPVPPEYKFEQDIQFIPPPPFTLEQAGVLPGVEPIMPLPSPLPSEPMCLSIYCVADLVVGQAAGTDPNQAMLAMLAQQSEEYAMMMQAAASTGQPQQDDALTELAATIESTFAAEFADGRGSITPHRSTHSLIIRQTDAVQTQIRDLLDQLRRINDTEIRVTIELSELNDTTTPFAMGHNGDILDEDSLQQYRDMTEGAQCKLIEFTVAARNGESTSLPAYALPGSVTAVASANRSDVRVLLDMLWGMETGISQQYSHRVPTGQTLLTIMAMEDTGLVVLLTAEVVEPENLEEALFGPEK